jgi:hypothetical protein
MYTHIYITFTRGYILLQIHTHTHTSVRVYMHVWSNWMYAFTWSYNFFPDTHIHTHPCTCVVVLRPHDTVAMAWWWKYLHVYGCTHERANIQMRVRAYTHMGATMILIHTYIHIHTHAFHKCTVEGKKYNAQYTQIYVYMFIYTRTKAAKTVNAQKCTRSEREKERRFVRQDAKGTGICTWIYAQRSYRPSSFYFTCLHRTLLNSSFIAYARAVLPRSPYVDVNLFLISSKKEKATLLHLCMWLQENKECMWLQENKDSRHR